MVKRFLWFQLGGQSVNAKGWLSVLGHGSHFVAQLPLLRVALLCISVFIA